MPFANHHPRRAGIRVAVAALLCLGFALFPARSEAAPTTPKISWSKCF